MIAFAGVCLLLSVTVRGYTLNQEHVTEQGLVDRAGSPSDRDVEAASSEKTAAGQTSS